MPPALLIIAYGITIVGSAVAGAYLPRLVQMNHVRMQILLSFIGGMMLGVAVLHLLPHGLDEIHRGMALTAAEGEETPSATKYAMPAMLIGLLLTFLLMRAFHFHQHGDEHEGETCHHHHHEHSDGEQPHAASHLSWLGVMFGLGLHSFMDGVALGAAVRHGQSHLGWLPAGFGVYLAILMHKPLDALSLSTLMVAEKRSWRSVIVANVCVGLLCLAGGLGVLYAPGLADRELVLGCLLAAAAGVFLCISLSDLLPEVQFHQHDRIPLTTALLAGIGVAFLIEQLH